MKKRLRQLLPWVVTIGILVFLLNKYDPEAVWGALKNADLAFLLPLWTAAVLVVYVADTGCLIHLFRVCRQKVDLEDLFRVKGASYLLNVINYNAAAGGIGYYVSRRTGTPLLEALSSMLMLSGIDLLALAAFVGLAFMTSPDFLPVDYEGPVLTICIVLVLGYLMVGLLWRFRSSFPFMARVAQWRILHCLRVSTFGEQLGLVGIRFLFMGLYFVTQYYSLKAFNIHIPLVELCGFNAILTLVGIIPLSIAGLGTTQWVMVALYTPYAAESLGSAENAEAVILAYSTAIIAYFVLLRVIIGYVSFARLSQELREGFNAPGEDSADPERAA